MRQYLFIYFFDKWISRFGTPEQKSCFGMEMRKCIQYRVSQTQFDGFCWSFDQVLMDEIHKFPTIKDTYQEIEFRSLVATYQLVEHLIEEQMMS